MEEEQESRVSALLTLNATLLLLVLLWFFNIYGVQSFFPTIYVLFFSASALSPLLFALATEEFGLTLTPVRALVLGAIPLACAFIIKVINWNAPISTSSSFLIALAFFIYPVLYSVRSYAGREEKDEKTAEATSG
ncbi:MAG: hypothetical protein ABIH99_05715 [Candidatus Micrarchaeota archaeon]